MDWLEAIDGLAIFALAAASIVQTVRMDRMQNKLDHTHHVAEMAFTALEGHLNGKHVELLNLTEDGTPIRETDQE